MNKEENVNVITGTIVDILPVEEISDGKYRKQVFAVKNNDGYEGAEAIYAFELFEKSDGDKIEKFRKFNKVGSFVDVSYEIRCNEHKGRYFTSLSAWKVFKAEGSGEATTAPAQVDDSLDEEIPF
jgi:hypothetical protein